VEGKRRITEVEGSETPTLGLAPKEAGTAGFKESGGTEYSWEPTPHTPASKKVKVGSWADEVEIELGTTRADGPHR